MAINFVASTYYGSMLLTAEELVETNPLQEVLEKHVDEKSDFMLSAFRFIPPVIEKEESFYNSKNSANFSIYEQDILLPPPDFFRFSS
jgi:hypothetical protein